MTAKNKRNPVKKLEIHAGKYRRVGDSDAKYKRQSKGMRETFEVSHDSAAFSKGRKLVKTSRIRDVGNSKGVILNSQLIETAGISPDKDILIEATEGMITIVQVKATAAINTDLSTWDAQFKAAMKKGAMPDEDLFEGLNNEFDTKEW